MVYSSNAETESSFAAHSVSVIKWNALTVRWLISKFSLHNKASAGLMLFAVCAFYSIFFIHGTNYYEQQDKRELPASFVGTSFAEKPRRKVNQTAEEAIESCQKEKEVISLLLRTERNNHRRTQTNFLEKLKLCRLENGHETDRSADQLVQEKKILQYVTQFMTAYREFFDYMAAALRDTPYPGIGNYTRYEVARLGMLPLAEVEPLVPEFGPVINDVTSFRYPIDIPPCQDLPAAAANHRTVFIAVISAPGNFNKRDVIRRTWLNHLVDAHQDGVVGVAGFGFIIGQTEEDELTQSKIEEENITYGDIIQMEMSDFYRNLSLKVAGLLNWLNRNCDDKADFVLKVDDDVYVNVRNLAHFLQSPYHHRSNQTMFGLGAGNLFPARDGQWNITFEDWPWNQYPPYFFGPAILMPGSTILPLLAACQTTPMMPFDDVYLTGMCTEKAGIQLQFSSNSTKILGMGLPGVPFACDVRRFIAWTTVSGTHMNNSHVATDDFYRNTTQCIIADSSGFNRTVDPSEFVHFYFN